MSQAEIIKSAVLSPCEKYRYELRRIWDESKGLVNFVMLNPSTADAELADKTMTRCQNFAAAWGYGGIILTNLFSVRLTESHKLKYVMVPNGPDSWRYIDAAAQEAAIVVCAWGNHGMARIQGMTMEARLRGFGVDLHCIRQLAGGAPEHPLYLPADLKPVRWPSG